MSGLFDLPPELAAGSAELSPDGVYRYELRRRWGNGPELGWVMLNPSIADAEVDDQTLRRCVSFTRSWGWGGLVVRNLFALRATDPGQLLLHPDPVGGENDHHLGRCGEQEVTVCAWGNWGTVRERAAAVLPLLRGTGTELRALGYTGTGAPRHPLRLSAATPSVLLQ